MLGMISQIQTASLTDKFNISIIYKILCSICGESHIAGVEQGDVHQLPERGKSDAVVLRLYAKHRLKVGTHSHKESVRLTCRCSMF